jgi:hypothetical protein
VFLVKVKELCGCIKLFVELFRYEPPKQLTFSALTALCWEYDQMVLARDNTLMNIQLKSEIESSQDICTTLTTVYSNATSEQRKILAGKTEAEAMHILRSIDEAEKRSHDVAPFESTIPFMAKHLKTLAPEGSRLSNTHIQKYPPTAFAVEGGSQRSDVRAVENVCDDSGDGEQPEHLAILGQMHIMGLTARSLATKGKPEDMIGFRVCMDDLKQLKVKYKELTGNDPPPTTSEMLPPTGSPYSNPQKSGSETADIVLNRLTAQTRATRDQKVLEAAQADASKHRHILANTIDEILNEEEGGEVEASDLSTKDGADAIAQFRNGFLSTIAGCAPTPNKPTHTAQKSNAANSKPLTATAAEPSKSKKKKKKKKKGGAGTAAAAAAVQADALPFSTTSGAGNAVNEFAKTVTDRILANPGEISVSESEILAFEKLVAAEKHAIAQGSSGFAPTTGPPSAPTAMDMLVNGSQSQSIAVPSDSVRCPCLNWISKLPLLLGFPTLLRLKPIIRVLQ